MEDKYIGWQCPKCLVIYAPSIDRCICCCEDKKEAEPDISLNERFIVGIGGLNTKVTLTNDRTSNTINICSGYISESVDGICSKCGMPEWKHYNVSYT